MTIRGFWAIAVLGLLAVSLAANMFSFGAIASFRQMSSAGLVHNIKDRMSGLPEEARPYLRAQLRERRAAFRQAGRALRKSGRELARAARSEPFVEATVREKAERHADNHLAMGRVFVDAAVAALGEMPPEIRAQVQLDRIRPGRFGGRPPPHHGGPPPE